MRLPAIRTTDVDFAVVGVPLDAATSYRSGARFGPEAMRSMSVLYRPYNPIAEIDLFDHLRGVDYGDVAVIPGYVVESYRAIESDFRPLADAGVVTVALGGDHSVTLPQLRALASAYGPLALVHFDAHTDTRPDHMGQLYGHGTPFRRAVEERLVQPELSIQVGIRASVTSKSDIQGSIDLGYEVLTTDDAKRLGAHVLGQKIADRVGNAKAFMTFDIDVVDPAFAPGTGTPSVAGLTSSEAVDMVRALQEIDFVGCDIVEVAPPYDDAGAITALLGAGIAYEFITLLAVRRGQVTVGTQATEY